MKTIEETTYVLSKSELIAALDYYGSPLGNQLGRRGEITFQWNSEKEVFVVIIRTTSGEVDKKGSKEVPAKVESKVEPERDEFLETYIGGADDPNY